MSTTLLWRLIIRVGFPTTVSGLLLAALLGWIPSPLLTKLESIEYQIWQNTILIRTICYNTIGNANKINCEPWKHREYE